MSGPKKHPLRSGTSGGVITLSAETPAELTLLANRLQQALGEQYVVKSVLGVGGFAAVFRVHDTDLKRDLAVKVLNPDLLTSSTTRERFQREAETVAKLSHPNVVHVHFIGREDDLLYIGMPCIEGGTLTARIKREGGLPIGEATRVITEVTGAIAHAHKKGVIHRDIKSQNVLIDEDSGRCIVTDFGIARTEDSSGTLTSTGLVIGTPAYLSPEQISGERGDHRVDVYALGVLAYEVVTGRLPFEGANGTAVMMKRFEGPPPLASSVRADVPPFLDAVIAKCLALDVKDRFQSADEILAELQAGLLGGTELMRTTGGRTRATLRGRPVRRMLLWGAVAVVAAVLLMNPLRSWFTKAPPVPPTIDDGPVLVFIPAGRYTIGSNAGPPESRPAHTVALRAFEISSREVSNAEYARATAGRSLPVPFSPADSMAPVTGISWDAAMRFCAALGSGSRLPTEEEWEAAARGLAGRSTPWDNVAPGSHANLASLGLARPAPVASYAIGATPEGVYDLIGNVWEWTASKYGPYPGSSFQVTRPGTYFVIRGGAFDTEDRVATPWLRGFADPAASAADLSRTGFRCAVSAVSAR